MTHEYPDLRSSIPNGSHVFADQSVTIVCTTTGSHVLAWRSDEYIGLGGEVSFISSLEQGNHQSIDYGFAILTKVYTNQSSGDIILESELHINVSPLVPVFTLTCNNGDLGLATNITFQLNGT